MILGIDPGTRVLGYGVVDGPAASYVACGVITQPKTDPAETRIANMATAVDALLVEYSPTHVAIERAYVHRDARFANAALRLAELRGVLRDRAQARGIDVREFAPSLWRKQAFGFGKMDKGEVASAIVTRFKLRTWPQEDACDALAIALAATREVYR